MVFVDDMLGAGAGGEGSFVGTRSEVGAAVEYRREVERRGIRDRMRAERDDIRSEVILKIPILSTAN